MSRPYFETITSQISAAFASLDEDRFSQLLDDCERVLGGGADNCVWPWEECSNL